MELGSSNVNKNQEEWVALLPRVSCTFPEVRAQNGHNPMGRLRLMFVIPHVDEPGAKQKIGSATVDLTLEPAKTVTTIDGAKSVAEGAAASVELRKARFQGRNPLGRTRRI